MASLGRRDIHIFLTDLAAIAPTNHYDCTGCSVQGLDRGILNMWCSVTRRMAYLKSTNE